MDVLSYVLPVIGLVTTAGGVVGFYKAAKNDAVNKYLSDAVRVRDIKITDQKEEIATANASLLEKDKQIAELKQHNAYLQKLGQGSPQLKKLTVVVERQAAVAEKLVEQVKGLLAREKNK